MCHFSCHFDRVSLFSPFLHTVPLTLFEGRIPEACRSLAGTNLASKPDSHRPLRWRNARSTDDARTWLQTPRPVQPTRRLERSSGSNASRRPRGTALVRRRGLVGPVVALLHNPNAKRHARHLSNQQSRVLRLPLALARMLSANQRLPPASFSTLSHTYIC